MRGLLILFVLVWAGAAWAQPAPLRFLSRDAGAELEAGSPRGTAFAARRTSEALRAFYRDPDYAPARDAALQAVTNETPPSFVALRFGEAFALLREPGRPRGSWSRASVADLKAGRGRWQALVDVDALATFEKTPWTFAGAACAPTGFRCMIMLGRDGGPAIEAREFDLERGRWVEPGLRIVNLPHSLAWLETGALLVAAADGPAATIRPLTSEGFGPPILTAAPGGTLTLRALRDVDGGVVVVAEEGGAQPRVRVVTPEGARPAAIPAGARIVGLHKGQLLFLAPDGLASAPVAPAEPTIRPLAAGIAAGVAPFGTSDGVSLLRGDGTIERFTFDGRAWVASTIATSAPGLTPLAMDPEEPDGLVLETRLEAPAPWRWLAPRAGAVSNAPGTSATQILTDPASGTVYAFAPGATKAVVIEAGRPIDDPARRATLLAAGFGAARVFNPTRAALIATAQDLVRRGLAAPTQIGIYAAGEAGGEAVAAIASSPDTFAAAALEEYRGPVAPTGLKAAILALGNAADPKVGEGRRFAQRARAVRYVETDAGGADFALGASPLDKARRAALVRLHFRALLER